MLRRARQSLSYANVMATIAVFLAAGGGGYALAAGGGRSVIHACVTRDGAVRLVGAKAKCDAKEHKVSWNRRGRRGSPGLTGAQGLPGTPGTPGAAGKDGTARAYAFVNHSSPTSLDPATTKGFTSLTHPQEGFYCLSGPGLDSRKFPALVSVEFLTTGVNVNDFVQWSHSRFCPAGDYEVVTLVQAVGSGGTVQSADSSDTVSFTILVP